MAQTPHPTPCLRPNHVTVPISVTIRVIDAATIIRVTTQSPETGAAVPPLMTLMKWVMVNAKGAAQH